MAGPRFAFDLHIVALSDQVPGPPDLRSLVSTSVQVSVAGTPAAMTADPYTFTYETFTDWPGTVPVQMLVVRHTHNRISTGSVQERGGQWYWVGDGQEIPLPANDPCVTRLWPGDRPMSDHDFDVFCKARIIEPPVAPGIVGTVDLAYELATERVLEIRGDMSVVRPLPGPVHRAGGDIHLHKDLSPNGALDLTFTITGQDGRGFARDIRPLFRDKDIESMRFAFDLSSYNDVMAHASDIYNAVSVVSSSFVMPCDGRWPPARILALRQWIDQGMPP